MKVDSELKNDENIEASALNLLSCTESEKLFAAMTKETPFPFYILWFVKMVEQFTEKSDEEGLPVMIHTLYSSLEINEPEAFNALEESGLLSRFADELIKDLAEIAEEEFLFIDV